MFDKKKPYKPKLMEKPEIVLKKSKRKLIVRVMVNGLIAVGCIVSEFIWANEEGSWVVILGGLVAAVACVFYIKELRSIPVFIIENQN